MIIGALTFDNVDLIVSENDEPLEAAFGKVVLGDKGIVFETSWRSWIKDLDLTEISYGDITRVGAERFYFRTGIFHRQDWIDVAVIEGHDFR